MRRGIYFLLLLLLLNACKLRYEKQEDLEAKLFRVEQSKEELKEKRDTTSHFWENFVQEVEHIEWSSPDSLGQVYPKRFTRIVKKKRQIVRKKEEEEVQHQAQVHSFLQEEQKLEVRKKGRWDFSFSPLVWVGLFLSLLFAVFFLLRKWP